VGCTGGIPWDLRGTSRSKQGSKPGVFERKSGVNSRSIKPQKALVFMVKRGAGDRDRTGMVSLEGWGSTIELHPRGDSPE
jgi:hypothetical protein